MKIFITKYFELLERFDPVMNLYNRKAKNSKYQLVPLKNLIVKSPQYGANEIGIERLNKNEPRYIRITDINEFGLLTDNFGATAENIEAKYLLNNDDILFARSGATVGKAYIHKSARNNYECFFAGYLIRFVVDKSKILPEYLFTYTQLSTYKEWVSAIQRPTGQPNINAEEYKSLQIPLPDIKIQQQIVDIINEAYYQKELKEKEAQNILSGIDQYFLNMLGIQLPKKKFDLIDRIFISKFSDISGNRFDSYYHQKHFKEFEIELLKSNYPVYSLKSLTQKITSGITPLSGGDAYTTREEGIPFIRSGDINIEGELNYDELLYIKPSVHENTMKSSQVLKNDILIAIVGATIGQVGIYLNEGEANINQAIALARLHKNIDPFYIKEFIKCSIGQLNLDRLKRPVARANINLEEISTLQIILPPYDMQVEISNEITQIRNSAKNKLLEAKDILEAAKLHVEKML